MHLETTNVFPYYFRHRDSHNQGQLWPLLYLRVQPPGQHDLERKLPPAEDAQSHQREVREKKKMGQEKRCIFGQGLFFVFAAFPPFGNGGGEKMVGGGFGLQSAIFRV